MVKVSKDYADELVRLTHERGGRVDGVMARGRTTKKDGMNKTETAYSHYLAALKASGKIAWYGYEPWKFRLAPKTYYSFDFAVMLLDGLIEIHEVKGYWEDDARVKWKVAAEAFPMFRFVAVQKDGAGWKEERL